MNNGTPPSSQGSSNLTRSGSVYVPTQSSTASSDAIGMTTTYFILNYDYLIKLIPDESDFQTETEGVNLTGSLLIVPWACLLILLSKCQRHGCGEQVLPSNMELSRKGN